MSRSTAKAVDTEAELRAEAKKLILKQLAAEFAVKHRDYGTIGALAGAYATLVGTER